MFYVQSNNTLMNYYNLLVSLAQRANIDISPYTDLYATIKYLSKYCTKAEQATFSFNATLRSILPQILATNRPVVQIAAKAINKIVSSRDQGTQEVLYLTLGLYLQKGTRVVISFDLRLPADYSRTIVLDNNKEAPLQEDARRGKSIL